MALTPFRWAALLIIGMLGVFLVVSRDLTLFQPTEAQLAEERMRYQMSIQSNRATTLVRNYRMAHLADSLRARGVVREPMRVSYGTVAPEFRTVLDSALVSVRERVGASPVMGVDVVALTDTTRIAGTRAWTSDVSQFFVLPTRPGDRCIVVLPFGTPRTPQWTLNILKRDEVRDQILGPCAYYAAFGMPGDSVRHWMLRRGVTLAQGGSWIRNPPPVRPQYYSSYYDTAGFYPNPPAVYFSYSGRGIQCLIGETSACERAIVEESAEYRQRAVGSAVRTSSGLGTVVGWYTSGTSFSGRETELFADMVRSLGRERFAQFWTSSEPVETAFQRASGMPMGEWLTTWANEGVPPFKRGPTIPSGTLGAGIGVIALCIALAIAASRRRTFA
jgi:hypothetical protein